MLGGMIGVFLVYLQHNFEDTYWDRKPDLDFRRATLIGSSSLDLGWWWDLGTGNIAYHDLHHYNPAIPSYNLRRCQRDLPEHLQCHAPIGWRKALRSFTLKLWDEDAGRLVPYPRDRDSRAGARRIAHGPRQSLTDRRGIPRWRWRTTARRASWYSSSAPAAPRRRGANLTLTLGAGAGGDHLADAADLGQRREELGILRDQLEHFRRQIGHRHDLAAPQIDQPLAVP